MKTTSHRARRPGARRKRLRLAAGAAALFGLGLFGIAPVAQADTGSIEGLVFEDPDLDGVRDAGEAPLANAPVSLVGSNDWNLTMQTTTDALGRYSFTGLASASYILTSGAVDGYRAGRGTIGSAGGESIRFPDYATTSFINLDPDEQATGYLFPKVPQAAVPPSTDLDVYLFIPTGVPILTDTPFEGRMFITNQGYREVPARVTLSLPAGVSVVTASPYQGSFDPATATWTVDLLEAPGSASIDFTLVSTGAGSKNVSATVDIPDPSLSDTDPGNDTMAADFDVIQGPLFDASFGEWPVQRILVLAACPPLAGGGEDAACLAARKSTLDALLDADHLVVTSEAEFITQLRSRNWHTYWLDSGAARTLGSAALHEITQAQWRGDGLVVDRPRGRSGGDIAGAQQLEALLPVTRVDVPEQPGIMLPNLYNWNMVPLAGGYDIYRRPANEYGSSWEDFWDANGPIDPNDPPRAFHTINFRTFVSGVDLVEQLQSPHVYGAGLLGQLQYSSAMPTVSQAAGRLTNVAAYPFVMGTMPAPIPAWYGVRFPGGLDVRKSSPDDAVPIAGGFAWTRELPADAYNTNAQFQVRLPVTSGTYDVTFDMRQTDAAGTPLAPLMTRTLTAIGAEDAADRVRNALPDAGTAGLADRLDAVDALMQQRTNGNLGAAIDGVVTLAAVVEPWRARSGPDLTNLATALGDLGAVLSREWYLALPPCAPPANLAGCRTPEP